MLLEIDDNKTIDEVQEKFHECFPSLRIAFFGNMHHRDLEKPWERQLDKEQKIGTIRRKHEPLVMDIKSWDNIGEVENRFRKELGLNVQILYSNNTDWIKKNLKDNLVSETPAEMK